MPARSSALRDAGWEKVKAVGRGSFGRVYIGACLYNANNHTMVAIKSVSKARHAQRGTQRYLEREGAIHRRLDSPHVVYMLQLIDTPTHLYLVLEFCPTDLSRQIAQLGKHSENLTCDYMRDLARGLYHLAQEGVIHRDLKPNNVLVSSERKVTR